MGSRPTYSSNAHKANPRKSPRRPKPLAGKPNWVELAKRLERAFTRSTRGNLKTDSAEQLKQRLASIRDQARWFVLEVSRGNTDAARQQIQSKLALIPSTAAVIAGMARRQEGPDAAVLDHLGIDPLTDRIAAIGVLLAEQVEKYEGAGAS